ncbi:MAG: hypothetical protein ABIK62_00130 [candidate division WOR-3 bacterium]
MGLVWRANAELDLAGYVLHRAINSGEYQRLNQTLLADTCYADSGLLADTIYRYCLAALDTAGHQSDSSHTVYSKPITLDHGILLVDETRDGNGQPGTPNDAQVDEFYHVLLDGYPFTDWDVARQGVPTAGGSARTRQSSGMVTITRAQRSTPQ